MKTLLERLVDWLVQRLGFWYIPDRLQKGPGILRMKGLTQVGTYTCGYVAGAMVVRFLKGVLPGQFIRTFSDIEGLMIPDMRKGLRHWGVSCTRKPIAYRNAVRSLQKGKPLLAFLNKGTHLHWVVIYGFSQNPAALLVAGDSGYFPFWRRPQRRLWRNLQRRLDRETGFLVCGCTTGDAASSKTGKQSPGENRLPSLFSGRLQ